MTWLSIRWVLWLCWTHGEWIEKVVVDGATVVSGGWDQRAVFWVKTPKKIPYSALFSEIGREWVQVQWGGEAGLLRQHHLNWPSQCLLRRGEKWIPGKIVKIVVAQRLCYLWIYLNIVTLLLLSLFCQSLLDKLGLVYQFLVGFAVPKFHIETKTKNFWR